MLDELFLERWSLLLDGDRRGRRAGRPAPREKLDAIAGFIIDSYRHDPELMKVIIVEVTRAANSFGRTHLPEIREAYDGDRARSSPTARPTGDFRADIDPDFAAMAFYGAIEQLLSGWIFDVIPAADEDFEQAKELRRRDDLRRSGGRPRSRLTLR